MNSPEAVKALNHHLRLTKYMPPVVKTGGMDALKTDELFREGKLAMNIEYIGLAENAIHPETSKVADKVAFAQMPGLRGADGKLVRWSNIGGQPFVIMTWSDDKQIKEIVEFVKWWLSTDTQHAFAAAGGQSAIKSATTTRSIWITARGTGPGRRASNGRRMPGTFRSSLSCSPSSRTSSTLPSPASRTPRPL